MILLIACGCSEEKFPVRPAKGKVLCGGKPVTVGSVSFVPIGKPEAMETGKAATATLGPDGTFILTTRDRFDGAIVGKHTVRYVGPEGEEEEEETSEEEGSPEERANSAQRVRERRAELKTLCVQKGEIIVEVKSDGENDFTIELTPAGG